MTLISLKTSKRQLVQPKADTVVRFDLESTDTPDWHKRNSGLIIPGVTAVGMLWGKVGWEDPEKAGLETVPTKYYLKFVRDPGTPAADQTAAVHWPPVPYGQNQLVDWPGTVRAGQPLALVVRHNGSGPLAIGIAEFKLWIP